MKFAAFVQHVFDAFRPAAKPLNEVQVHYRPTEPSQFVVDYYVVTPRGTRSRFVRQVGLTQIRNARSETSVLYYLKARHPGTDIIIQNLSFQ